MAKKKAVAKRAARKSNGRAKSTRRASKSKDDQVEQSEGVQLLLGNMPPDKDLLHHYENILSWEAKLETMKGYLRKAKEVAKEAGCDLGALATVKKHERMDPLDLATSLRQQAQLGSIRGLPVQMQLYEPKYGSVEEQAEAEGRADGKNGRSPSSRWKEDAPGYAQYMASWQAEQGKLVEALRSA